MKRISEVITEHIDEELNATYVDVYVVGSEEGTVAAVVCNDTGKVFYRDYIWASYEQVTTAIQEVVDQVQKPKVPKIIAVVNGGVITSVVGDAPIDIHVIDYDCEDEDPELCHEIPQGEGKTEMAVAYQGEIFEEDADRTYELLEAINK